MTWSPGENVIREQVEPSVDVADLLIADAKQHTLSAKTILQDGDLTGAYQLAYDALRKSGTSLLAVQGLRATTRGGHIAVQDEVIAQFGATIPAFRAFGRLRRNRNRFEYPSDVASEPTEDDVIDALKAASEAADRADTILREEILDPW